MLTCTGFKSSSEFVSSLFNECDIAILRETWLLPNELGLLSNLRIDSDANSTSVVDLSDDILIGRPYGGLIFMWKTELSKFTTVRRYEDPRMLGLSLTCNGKTLLLLNVYLLDTRMTEDEKFIIYIGKTFSIFADCGEDNICVMGDFNCIPDSERFEDFSRPGQNIDQFDTLGVSKKLVHHINFSLLPVS